MTCDIGALAAGETTSIDVDVVPLIRTGAVTVTATVASGDVSESDVSPDLEVIDDDGTGGCSCRLGGKPNPSAPLLGSLVFVLLLTWRSVATYKRRKKAS